MSERRALYDEGQALSPAAKQRRKVPFWAMVFRSSGRMRLDQMAFGTSPNMAPPSARKRDAVIGVRIMEGQARRRGVSCQMKPGFRDSAPSAWNPGG